ncbi:MAG: helix-turn-helix transcriptional regulator [Clostridia bacterium]|nr:helix-turn-helix transcriptional regulator [Clostridia bacterium]
MTIKQLNSPVAENVQRIIKESGLKQLVVAKRIGCTSQELTDMIYGRRIIKINDVPKLCTALNVDIGSLFVCCEQETKAV